MDWRTRRVFRVGGQVDQAVGVGRHVVQLLGRSLAEGPLPIVAFDWVVAALEDLRLGGTAIAVQITGLGVSRRPA